MIETFVTRLPFKELTAHGLLHFRGCVHTTGCVCGRARTCACVYSLVFKRNVIAAGFVTRVLALSYVFVRFPECFCVRVPAVHMSPSVSPAGHGRQSSQ